MIEPLGLMVLGNSMKSYGYDIHYFLYKGSDIIDEISKIYRIKDFDVIGFSTYTGNHIEVYEACKKLKKLDIRCVIGGPHATFFYEECKQYADKVFRGESVVSFPHMNDETIFELVDPNGLIPDRVGFYKESPFHRDNRIKNIMTSFGCPFTCSYCYNS